MEALHYKYLLIGGGMSADAAARGIRQVDPNGTIGLIGREVDAPYNRPPLSKGVWKRTPIERLSRKTASLGVELHLGRQVISLNPAAHTVMDDQQHEYQYEKLLLATGGDPIRLPGESARIVYYRTLDDYRCLRPLVDTAQQFTVLGGGFIGSEMTAVLNARGKQVALMFLDEGILGRVMPPTLAAYLNEYFAEKGIRVMPGERVESLADRGDQIVARTATGIEVASDVVLAGLGIRPNLDLPRQAGLEVNNGIVVDPSMRTSAEDIYAAGDVINFNCSGLGKRMRVEHEEHANMSGMAAGQSMAGANVTYDPIPAAYSSIFDFYYDAVGDTDARLECFIDWIDPFRQGVLYYLQDQRVRGVLLWNIPGKVEAARALIQAGETVQPESLKGKISL